MRVAVTGVGVVSPLGNGAAAAFANAQAGRSGIHRLAAPFAARLVAPLAASASFDGAGHFEPPKLRMLDRVSQVAIVAARQAIAGACDVLSQLDRSRAGVFVGTGMGGSQTSDDGYKTLYGDDSDRIKPFTVLMGMHNAPAAWIGIEHDLRGPNLTYSTACSSSAVAIGEAWRRVACGDLEVAIAGGAEAPLSFGSLKAWEALHTLAAIDTIDPSASCKPFAKNRSGMVLGEGAAMLVLEPWERAVARGASIHGEILGYGLSTDVSHITRPSVEGQAAAIHAALRAAAIVPLRGRRHQRARHRYASQ
jgi:3-oxoacyl-[acyl-carrier-protein] synthase II